MGPLNLLPTSSIPIFHLIQIDLDPKQSDMRAYLPPSVQEALPDTTPSQHKKCKELQRADLRSTPAAPPRLLDQLVHMRVESGLRDAILGQGVMTSFPELPSLGNSGLMATGDTSIFKRGSLLYLSPHFFPASRVLGLPGFMSPGQSGKGRQLNPLPREHMLLSEI